MTEPETDAATVAPIDTTVAGRGIRYRRWGDGDRPLVMLIHGGGAHLHWWDHVAPRLAGSKTAVALDLAGHGDSARRETYDLETWADDVRSVVDDVGIERPPLLIGHSMGAWVSAVAAPRFSTAGAVMVDPLFPTPEHWTASSSPRRPNAIYASREEALTHFRLVPEQHGNDPEVLSHLAAESVRSTPEGWTWKFDPRIFAFPRPTADLLEHVQMPLTLIRAERGLADVSAGEQFEEHAPAGSTQHLVRGAGHHLMVDHEPELTELLLAEVDRLLPDRARDGGTPA